MKKKLLVVAVVMAVSGGISTAHASKFWSGFTGKALTNISKINSVKLLRYGQYKNIMKLQTFDPIKVKKYDSVAIVGAGPRGTFTLLSMIKGRWANYIRGVENPFLEVHVFDPFKVDHVGAGTGWGAEQGPGIINTPPDILMGKAEKNYALEKNRKIMNDPEFSIVERIIAYTSVYQEESGLKNPLTAPINSRRVHGDFLNGVFAAGLKLVATGKLNMNVTYYESRVTAASRSDNGQYQLTHNPNMDPFNQLGSFGSEGVDEEDRVPDVVPGISKMALMTGIELAHPQGKLGQNTFTSPLNPYALAKYYRSLTALTGGDKSNKLGQFEPGVKTMIGGTGLSAIDQLVNFTYMLEQMGTPILEMDPKKYKDYLFYGVNKENIEKLGLQIHMVARTTDVWAPRHEASPFAPYSKSELYTPEEHMALRMHRIGKFGARSEIFYRLFEEMAGHEMGYKYQMNPVDVWFKDKLVDEKRVPLTPEELFEIYEKYTRDHWKGLTTPLGEKRARLMNAHLGLNGIVDPKELKNFQSLYNFWPSFGRDPYFGLRVDPAAGNITDEERQEFLKTYPKYHEYEALDPKDSKNPGMVLIHRPSGEMFDAAGRQRLIDEGVLGRHAGHGANKIYEFINRNVSTLAAAPPQTAMLPKVLMDAGVVKYVKGDYRQLKALNSEERVSRAIKIEEEMIKAGKKQQEIDEAINKAFMENIVNTKGSDNPDDWEYYTGIMTSPVFNQDATGVDLFVSMAQDKNVKMTYQLHPDGTPSKAPSTEPGGTLTNNPDVRAINTFGKGSTNYRDPVAPSTISQEWETNNRDGAAFQAGYTALRLEGRAEITPIDEAEYNKLMGKLKPHFKSAIRKFTYFDAVYKKYRGNEKDPKLKKELFDGIKSEKAIDSFKFDGDDQATKDYQNRLKNIEDFNPASLSAYMANVKTFEPGEQMNPDYFFNEEFASLMAEYRDMDVEEISQLMEKAKTDKNLKQRYLKISEGTPPSDRS